MKELYPWLWIAAIAVVFWLLIIRPAARRQREVSALHAALSVGDDVILTSGVFATIVGAADDHLEVEIAPGVVIHIVRGAVASLRVDTAHDAADDAEQATDPDEANEVDPSTAEADDAVPTDNEDR
ncbi:preprotein translocase subunit YajC [Nocardioides sp. WS12]|uniref:preprotein translocase subunit YajC n=1 Tax=Nocardioides sp. WS12 TaxID=2486272 RepID=UPI0015F8E552|nr:preprotein translocase subunit YajC [Nocardioides sp. WS12]